ncbi:DUF3592 domain-containing protein [Amycolatopsis sp. NPDC088138]|uniref:DUF3592 domain-containing protein n=1 Tax=Amycolatopsis sp. NPDC088138 TaxID=3363938 RepID=UPI00381CD8A8
MTLGMDRDATTHRRWQNTFLAGAIVFGLAAVGDAAGTGYALTAPGYLFEDGEFAGEVTVFVVAAALMLGCVALAGFAAMSASADHLLKTGVRVTGKVLGVYRHSRGEDTIHVAYPVGYGHFRYADIVWDSGRQYTEGQPITVVYDKADPDRVRTPDETNGDQTWTWVLVLGTIAAGSGLVLSVIAAVNWRRRYRAVSATGWRIASVTVVPDYPVRKGRHMPDITVAYRDGTRITLRAATSSHGSVPLKQEPNRRAWIGGTDRDMVVLFPHGRWREAPFAVPAYALNTRTGPR